MRGSTLRTYYIKIILAWQKRVKKVRHCEAVAAGYADLFKMQKIKIG